MMQTSFKAYYKQRLNLLSEGGLAGHMTHVYEDLTLTFKEFKDLFKNLITSKIEAYEKVDGQNIYFTWDTTTNQTKFARNKSEAEKGGITLDELKAKFKDRGSVEIAFSEGGDIINMALSTASKEISNVFNIKNYSLNSGNVWINAEIMHSINPNVLQYSGNNIVLHDMDLISNEEIPPDAEDKIRQIKNTNFKQLVDLVNKAEAKQSTSVWQIVGPQIRKITSFNKESGSYTTFVNQINNIIGRFKLNDSNTLRDYVELASIEYFKQNKVNEQGAKLLGMLVAEKYNRANKKEIVKQIKDSGSDTKLASDVVLNKVKANVLTPLQKAVCDISIEVLKGVSSFFIKGEQQQAEAERIRAELQQVIAAVENTKDEHYEKRKEFLDRELGKLKDVLNFASAIEGLVVEYPPGSGKKLKITGAFAPANQILGMAKYGRGPIPPIKTNENV